MHNPIPDHFVWSEEDEIDHGVNIGLEASECHGRGNKDHALLRYAEVEEPVGELLLELLDVVEAYIRDDEYDLVVFLGKLNQRINEDSPIILLLDYFSHGY